MDIKWIELANKSFEEEVNFIIRKWNTNEAIKFLELIKDFLSLLRDNPYLGKPSGYKKYRQFVLSTQTNIWYQIDEVNNVVYIVLFWNNKKDQRELKKLL